MRPIEVLLREGIEAGQFGGDCEPHGEHAMGFVGFSGGSDRFRGHVIDLGSGAGLPALPLADRFSDTTWTLIERRGGRAELLRRAVHRLDLADRVTVMHADAAVLAWTELRGSADWVTARAFGPPATTAEVAGPFLRVGGSLLVSEPRDAAVDERWPADAIARCGLVYAEVWELRSGRFARFERNSTPLPMLPRKGARKKLLF